MTNAINAIICRSNSIIFVLFVFSPQRCESLEAQVTEKAKFWAINGIERIEFQVVKLVILIMMSSESNRCSPPAWWRTIEIGIICQWYRCKNQGDDKFTGGDSQFFFNALEQRKFSPNWPQNQTRRAWKRSEKWFLLNFCHTFTGGTAKILAVLKWFWTGVLITFTLQP